MTEEVSNTENTETTTETTVSENSEAAPAAEAAATPEGTKEAPAPAKAEGSHSNSGPSGSNQSSHGDRPQRNDRPQRVPRFKRKVCKFCYEKDAVIDYKNTDILERFITDRGKILPRRVTGTCSKHQRALATAIKRARIIALLPFMES
jgi:small subunit ribosomal protein S18